MNTLDIEIIHQAADLIATPGVWVQGRYDDGERVCPHGAVLRPTCTPGDGLLWRQVMKYRGFTEAWNDADGRTLEEVEDRFRSMTAPATDEMASIFGPQWESIVAFARRAAVLTSDEAKELGAPSFTPSSAASFAARSAASFAASFAARSAACHAVSSTARSAAWSAAWYAAWSAAAALAVRDLVGSHGFTQAHYDKLTEPWAQVVGKVHPDDSDRLVEVTSLLSTDVKGDPIDVCIDCSEREATS